MSTKPVLVLIGIALLALPVGCSERRRNRVYREITGNEVRNRVDLNSASQRQLERLPGLTAEDAGRIIANRPYPNKNALLRRGIIGEGKYEQIEDHVYVSGRQRGDRRDNRDDD